MDPDPYWICFQELPGSGSVFWIRIRIHTCKYWLKWRQKMQDLSYKFTIQRLNQCCGSKYIEFGSGSRILTQFGSGSRKLLNRDPIWIHNTAKYIFCQLSLWIVNLYLKSCIFCLHFNLYLYVWIRIRIQEAPEYGSNRDPGPQHWTKQTKNFFSGHFVLIVYKKVGTCFKDNYFSLHFY